MSPPAGTLIAAVAGTARVAVMATVTVAGAPTGIAARTERAPASCTSSTRDTTRGEPVKALPSRRSAVRRVRPANRPSGSALRRLPSSRSAVSPSSPAKTPAGSARSWWRERSRRVRPRSPWKSPTRSDRTSPVLRRSLRRRNRSVVIPASWAGVIAAQARPSSARTMASRTAGVRAQTLGSGRAGVTTVAENAISRKRSDTRLPAPSAAV